MIRTVNIPFLAPTINVTPPGDLTLQPLEWPPALNSGIAVDGASLTGLLNYGNSRGSGLPLILNGGTGLRAVLEFTHNDVNTYDIGGFTTRPTTNAFIYGFQLGGGAYWTIVLNEAEVPGVGGSFVPTDIFRLELYGDKVVWLKNGTVVYTLSGDPASGYTQLYASVLFYTQGGSFPSFKLGTSAFTGILPPVDGSLLSIDASVRVSDLIQGFTPLHSPLFSKDNEGAISSVVGAKRAYEPVFASYFRLDAPHGRGLTGDIRMQITRQGDNNPTYTGKVTQNGTASGSTAPLEAILSLDRYVVEIIHVSGSQVGFDGISVRR